MIRGYHLGRTGVYHREIFDFGINLGWNTHPEHEHGVESLLESLNASNLYYYSLRKKDRLMRKSYKSFTKEFHTDEYKEHLLLSDLCSLYTAVIYIRNEELKSLGTRCLLHDGLYRLFVIGGTADCKVYESSVMNYAVYSEDFFLHSIEYQFIKPTGNMEDWVAGSWGDSSYILILLNIDDESRLNLASLITSSFKKRHLLLYDGILGVTKSRGLTIVDAEELMRRKAVIT